MHLLPIIKRWKKPPKCETLFLWQICTQPLGRAVQCRGHLELTLRHLHALGHDINTGLIQQSSPIDLSLYHLDLEEITSSSTKRPETIDEGVPSRPFHLRANTLELALLILREHESCLGAFLDAGAGPHP